MFPYQTAQQRGIESLSQSLLPFYISFRISTLVVSVSFCCVSDAQFLIIFFVVVIRIITQPRLNWWPQIDLVYSKSSELRAMFTDTLNKVTQGYISHTPLRVIQSFTLGKGKDSQTKFKERAEEVPGYRNLLLYMVRLIHADPMLMLNVSI